MKPARRITHWSPLLINDRYVSLTGVDQYGEPWVSSTLAQIDVDARTARTISGRPYEFVGPHNPDGALRSALGVLSTAFDLRDSTVEPITLEQAAEWLAAQASKPALTEAEMERSEEIRRHRVWRWLGFSILASGLTPDEAAEVSGLPVTVIESLKQGVQSVDGISTDVLEIALGRLRDAEPGVGMAP